MIAVPGSLALPAVVADVAQFSSSHGASDGGCGEPARRRRVGRPPRGHGLRQGHDQAVGRFRRDGRLHSVPQVVTQLQGEGGGRKFQSKDFPCREELTCLRWTQSSDRAASSYSIPTIISCCLDGTVAVSSSRDQQRSRARFTSQRTQRGRTTFRNWTYKSLNLSRAPASAGGGVQPPLEGMLCLCALPRSAWSNKVGST